MEAFMSVIVFYMGACFGSFYNVIIDRLPREISFVHGRSYCPKCKHSLSTWDLFPIISFLFLKGRCRYCGTSIPIRSLLVEVLSGLLFFLAFYKYGLTAFALIQLIFWGMLIVIGFIDYDTMYIYDSMLLFYFIIFAVFYSVTDFANIMMHIKGGIYCFVIFAVIYFVAKMYYGQEAFGFGDVLLNAVIGFYLGSGNVLFICFLPFYVAVFDLLFRRVFAGKLSMKAEISFGPYMCISAWLISLYADEFHLLLARCLGIFGGA